MRRNYTSQEKEMEVKRYLSGESVSIISKSTDIARSTIYAWTKKHMMIATKRKIPLIYEITKHYCKGVKDRKEL